ncbi:MAG TPA: CoB--CoM heterodisulfide reductase iron-sulfur subunit B family protein [Bryobacteraceae bacterium]|nr:CoB--CoM heterodisulfide reductase iron-sulfur subunit B family protein [Bryobacteraceae bacterium]
MAAYCYYPGCSLRGTGIAYEESLLAVFKLLHLPIEELRDWNCCGATSYMSIDEGSACVLSARNLALARQLHYRDIVAPCSACYLVLRKTQDYVQRYPRIGRRVEESLGAGRLHVLNEVRVRHPLEVLHTDVGLAKIKARVLRQWPGGKVACYYGCQMVRPYADGDPDHNPVRMDELMHAAGVSTVDFPLKTRCCGGTLTGTMPPVGIRLNEILLAEAHHRGAEAMVTVCPLCQYNLDAYQSELRHRSKTFAEMPVFFFTQVLGWALGGDPARLGLKRAISGRRQIAQWFPKQRAEAAAHV